MPPRKKQSITKPVSPRSTRTVQLKRHTQTFFITLPLPVTVTAIKSELNEIITEIGGLSDLTTLEDGEDGEDQIDIDIPVPTFGELDSEDEDEGKEKQELTAASNNDSKVEKIIPSLDDLVIGRAVDRNDFYAGRWITLEDGEGVEAEEFELLAFRVQGVDGDEFEVVEPAGYE